MKQAELDQQLREYYAKKEFSWGKIVSQLKRQFDGWATAELVASGYSEFKMGYMTLLVHIQPEGTTNNELAKKAKITKQAMSKIVKELVELGYAEQKVHGQDKRSAVVFLTTKGKKLLISARQKVEVLEKEYEALLGEKKFTALKKSLAELISYHDQNLVSCI
jgi:DNA-binding MarR family transcriptional regulator